MSWVLVAVGGMLGAPARYLLDRSVRARRGRAFPHGTVAVNVLGCLVLGACTGLALHGLPLALVGAGFCGAFTTFSTFTFETVALFEDGLPVLAVANVAVSLVLGLGAAALGYAIA